MSVVMSIEARFREMFDATYPVVARYARHRGLSGEDLEDLVSATFEVAWRRFDQVPTGDEALPWLLGVALNHLRNHRRRVARDQGLLERLPAPEPVPGPSTPGVSWREIRVALERLSATDRELVMLVAWDELRPAQAGRVLGLTPGASRTRLHRARIKLAAGLNLDRGAGDSSNRDPAAEHTIRSGRVSP
jgi:RNA polymerase sigma-70 factor (ECF subfamily)